MDLSKRQKTLAALCVVGLVILVVDRLQLGSGELGPETAQASFVPVDTTPAEAETMEVLPEATGISKSRNELSNRLEAMAIRQDLANNSLRDMFQPSEAWLEQLGAHNSKPTIAAAPIEASFINGHKLQAVLVGKDGGSAIVNSTCLKIGQEFDGYKLVSICMPSSTSANSRPWQPS